VSGKFESSFSTKFLSTFLEGTWNMIYLVLLMLRAILLLWNQIAIFLSSVLTLVISVCKSESESSPVVSSAYRTENSSVALGKSLIKHRNRMGPREVPCNTDSASR
jgi:hypothetical protein